MISESGSVEAMMRSPGFPPFSAATMDHQRLDRLDPMLNQMCRVCEEPAAGFHFGAFTCEGCKSFFGRTCNNQSVIQECKNNYRCVVDKKNRTACKACRLRKCLMIGMSKSGSRYGRRSNWFKIHCLMQQSLGLQANGNSPKKSPHSSGGPGSQGPPLPSLSTEVSPMSSSSLSPNSPPSRPWSSSRSDHHHQQHRESSLASPPKMEDFRNRSPESMMSHSPTMVPRTSSIGAPPTSPFASLMPQPPVSPPPMIKAASTEAAQHPLASMSPYFGGGFPGLHMMAAGGGNPGFPGFPGLPFHKQALLSPLLAHMPHIWQMANARANNPLLNAKPELDLMAEHKALMERFAAAAMAAQSHAVAQAAAAASSIKEEVVVEPASPPPSPKIAASTPEPPQNAPIDLSNKRSDEEDSDMEDMEVVKTSNSLYKKKVKSDLNRNVVVNSSSGEDDEDEELDVGENLSR